MPTEFGTRGNSADEDQFARSPSNPAGAETCPVAVVPIGYQVTCGGKPLVNERYESGRETQLNYLPQTYAGSYHKTDLTLTNIATGGLLAASLEPPRTFGVRFGADFQP